MWYGSGEVQFCLIGMVYQICKFAQLSLQISSLSGAVMAVISKELRGCWVHSVVTCGHMHGIGNTELQIC